MQRICWSVVALIAIAGQAEAGLIVAPVGVTANTMGDPLLSIGKTFDQSGLNVGYTSGVTDFDAYVAGTPTHAFVVAGVNGWSGSS